MRPKLGNAVAVAELSVQVSGEELLGLDQLQTGLYL